MVCVCVCVTAVFQKQLSEGKFALQSCEELLEFANQTLTITEEEEFLKVELEEPGFPSTPGHLKPAFSLPGCQTDQRTVGPAFDSFILPGTDRHLLLLLPG